MLDGYFLGFFNQYLFAEVKANIQSVEYYYSTNPATSGNNLIRELIGAIKTYDLDAIGYPLFQSILIRCGKNSQESEMIVNEVLNWKQYSREQMEPARKHLRDICAHVIIERGKRLLGENNPSEFLKYIKNSNIVTSDLDVFSSVNFSDIDINSIVADSDTDFVPSRYDWINNTFSSKPGYEKNQMVIVTGRPGTGKSLWMMSEALYMAAAGRKVLYIALGDLSIKDFVIRMGAMYSGCSFSDTHRNINQISAELRQALQGNLEISVNKAGQVSVEEIVDKVKACPEFEVIFVDYDSNIKGASEGESMYNSYGVIYEKLYEIASLGKLLFVGSQPKIGAWGNAVLEMQDVGESARKQHTADIIIGIGYETCCPNHIHTFKISKNRRGEENVTSYSIRLGNGRFIEIPRGVYQELRAVNEKRFYTEQEIELMKSNGMGMVDKLENPLFRAAMIPPTPSPASRPNPFM